MHRLLEQIKTYELQITKPRKVIIAEIDLLVARLYSISEEDLRKIALSFTRYYSAQEAERLF